MKIESVWTHPRQELPADLDRARSVFLLVVVATYVMAAASVGAGQAFAQARTPVPEKRADIRRNLPLTKFYDTPNPLPAGKPGTVIRSEPFDEYDLPPGVSAVRILYHSQSAAGNDVAVSGVVLIPDETPPAGGWPVIAWAHESTGVARACAPSLMRNLHHGPFLSMYVNLGYAVVATDYAGLGTSFRNAFSDILSNATDVIDSIPAARAAVPQLGSKWVAMGDNDGALAVLGVAELESDTRDPDYLGSIAISGVADAKDRYEQVARGPSHNMLAFLAYGISTVYPRFQVNDMLTEKALPVYRQIGQGCANTGTIPEVSAADMLKPNWESNEFVKQFLARNTLGQKPAYGPLLVISGEADSAVPIVMTAQVVARLCKQGDRVQFEKYPGLDSGRVIGGAVRDQIAWIQARFAAGPAAQIVPDIRSVGRGVLFGKPGRGFMTRRDSGYQRELSRMTQRSRRRSEMILPCGSKVRTSCPVLDPRPSWPI